MHSITHIGAGRWQYGFRLRKSRRQKRKIMTSTSLHTQWTTDHTTHLGSYVLNCSIHLWRAHTHAHTLASPNTNPTAFTCMPQLLPRKHKKLKKFSLLLKRFGGETNKYFFFVERQKPLKQSCSLLFPFLIAISLDRSPFVRLRCVCCLGLGYFSNILFYYSFLVYGHSHSDIFCVCWNSFLHIYFVWAFFSRFSFSLSMKWIFSVWQNQIEA